MKMALYILLASSWLNFIAATMAPKINSIGWTNSKKIAQWATVLVLLSFFSMEYNVHVK